MQPVLETPRLLLRPFEEEDLDDLAAMYADPDVMAFWPRPYTRDEAAAHLQRFRAHYEERGYGLLAVLDRHTGEFVGRCGLLRATVWGGPEIELGWMIVRRRWGEGLAPEAGRALAEWAFDNLVLDRLVSLIQSANVASVRVAQKLGMVRIGQDIHVGLPHEVWLLRRPEDIG